MKRLLLGLVLGVLVANVSAKADGQQMYVTGYTCDLDAGQPYCGGTADGTQVAPGVAACPTWMPFGTVVRVWATDAPRIMGDYVCHDRGPQWLDIWFPTLQDCYAVTGMHRIEILPPSDSKNVLDIPRGTEGN